MFCLRQRSYSFLCHVRANELSQASHKLLACQHSRCLHAYNNLSRTTLNTSRLSDSLNACPGVLQSSIHGHFVFVPSRGKGHSHWQNIKHIKGAEDKKYNELTNRFVNLLRVTIKGNILKGNIYCVHKYISLCTVTK